MKFLLGVSQVPQSFLNAYALAIVELKPMTLRINESLAIVDNVVLSGIYMFVMLRMCSMGCSFTYFRGMQLIRRVKTE